MSATLTLGFVHGLDDLVLLVLLGSLVFRLLILPAGGEQAVALDPRIPARLRALLALALAGSIAWMLLSAAAMADSWLPSDVWTALQSTAFGHVWGLRTAVLLAAYAFGLPLLASNKGMHVLTAAILLLPLAGALTAHAGAQPEGAVWSIGLDWLHTLAVAVWAGGLYSLYHWLGALLGRPEATPVPAAAVIRRFSHIATASTAVIFVAGFCLAYRLGITWAAMVRSDYGRLLLLKIALLGVALVAASVNRYALLRRTDALSDHSLARIVRRGVLVEIVFLTLIFGVTGFLARTPLPMP